MTHLYRWTPDAAILKIDLERAITRALGNDPKLIQKFDRWFVAPYTEPECDLPRLSGPDARTHSRIVQRCALEFRRIGLGRLAANERLHRVAKEYFDDKAA